MSRHAVSESGHPNADTGNRGESLESKKTIQKNAMESIQAQVESFLLGRIESDVWQVGTKYRLSATSRSSWTSAGQPPATPFSR